MNVIPLIKLFDDDDDDDEVTRIGKTKVLMWTCTN